MNALKFYSNAACRSGSSLTTPRFTVGGIQVKMFGVWKKHRAKPRIAPGLRIYAVTDIHGRADLLSDVFSSIDRDLLTSNPKRAIHVFLGDYIDRGPASRETIDILVERARKFECVFLKGNHELILFEALRTPAVIDDWRQHGGLQTLASYGLKPSLKPDIGEQVELMMEFNRQLPDHHRWFFNSLLPSFSCGDFFFVHAGIRPGVPLSQQTEQDMCWIRDEFLLSTTTFEKYIVHGHSPVHEPDIRSNRINIDTGAYATGRLSLLTIYDNILLVT